MALFLFTALLPVAAQSILTTLHDFTATGSNFTNADGAGPFGGVVLSGGLLYGATDAGGTSGKGTVFAVNLNGTVYTNLHSFAATAGASSTNTEGANPDTGLLLLGNTLYGTATSGGKWGSGTVFAINTNGTGFTNLYSFSATAGSGFTNGDGAYPYANLAGSGNLLYGTTVGGGTHGNGSVFAVSTNGASFTNLHSFATGEGTYAYAGVFLSGDSLYGTTSAGGANGYGTVFALNTNGSNFANLHYFTNGSDGANPLGGVILAGSTLYGAARFGGTNGYGTVFAVGTNGTGFKTLHGFSSPPGDGANPVAGLVLSGNVLYGTASQGGISGVGTVFTVNTNGTGFTNLFNFRATAGSSSTNSGGARPQDGLVLSGYTLYATAIGGGKSGNGTVFALNLLPALGIAPAGNQVVISWPGWTPNSGLQTTTNLSSGGWSNIVSGITSSGSRNVFTNSTAGKGAFFRLQSQ